MNNNNLKKRNCVKEKQWVPQLEKKTKEYQEKGKKLKLRNKQHTNYFEKRLFTDDDEKDKIEVHTHSSDFLKTYID